MQYVPLGSAAGRGPPRSKPDECFSFSFVFSFSFRRRCSIASSTHQAGTGRSISFSFSDFGSVSFSFSFSFLGSFTASFETFVETSTGLAGSKTASCGYPPTCRHSLNPSMVFEYAASLLFLALFAFLRSSSTSVAIAPGPSAFRFFPSAAPFIFPLASNLPSFGIPPPPVASFVSWTPNLPSAIIRSMRRSTVSAYRLATTTGVASPVFSSEGDSSFAPSVFFPFVALPIGLGAAGGGTPPPVLAIPGPSNFRLDAMSRNAIHCVSPALFTSRSSRMKPLTSH